VPRELVPEICIPSPESPANRMVAVDELAPADQDRLRQGYHALGLVEDAAARCAAAGDDGVDAFRQEVDRLDPERLLRLFDGLGVGEGAPPRVRRAIHDLRGGALTGLIVHLELVQDGLGRARDVLRAQLLARDQRKIVRHLLPGLDPERHTADLAAKEHRVDLVVHKWSGASWGGRVVEVDNTFRGVISERCFEFAAVDRVVYNLVTNAARHGGDGPIHLRLEPLPTPDGVMLRGSVENALPAPARDALRARFGDDARRLFQGGFTTNGTGQGLQICAELVTHAFGLGDPMVAVDRHLVGALVGDDAFVTWFCWPARLSVGAHSEGTGVVPAG
jgi:hypothetical protein